LPLLPFYPSKGNSEAGFCGLDVATSAKVKNEGTPHESSLHGKRF